MFFKGFLIVSSLEPKYLSKVIQKCKMNRLFEGGHSGNASHSTPEVVVEVFSFGKYSRKAKEESEFLNMQLMEEMVDKYTMERFN